MHCNTIIYNSLVLSLKVRGSYQLPSYQPQVLVNVCSTQDEQTRQMPSWMKLKNPLSHLLSRRVPKVGPQAHGEGHFLDLKTSNLGCQFYIGVADRNLLSSIPV